MDQFTQLQVLRLSHNEITADGLYQLLEHIAQHPNLKHLLLDYNYISFNDYGMQRVRELLAKTSLINLDLSMNFIQKGATVVARDAHNKHDIVVVYDRQNRVQRTHDQHRVCKTLFELNRCAVTCHF